MIKYNQKYDRWVTDTGEVYRQDKLGAFVLCKQSDSNGYKQIAVAKPNRTSIKVHKLVWETFKGLVPVNMEIDHLDTDKNNNDLSNLRLCTPKENSNNPLSLKHRSETRRNETRSEFSKKFKEHYGFGHYENHNLYTKEQQFYRRNGVCSWEVE